MTSSIFKKLFPQNEPLSLLIEHALILEESVKLLKPLFESYFNQQDISPHANKISRLESQADDIKFKIRKSIASGIRIPFDKADFLDYLHNQEHLIDCSKDIAKKLSINQVILDQQLTEKIMELVDEVITLIDYLENAIKAVKSVVYFSFSNKSTEQEKEEIATVERYESKVDKHSLKIARNLYQFKDELNPVDLIFIESVLLILSEMGDYAENAADLLLSFIK